GVLRNGGSGSTMRRRGPLPPVTRATAAGAAAAGERTRAASVDCRAVLAPGRATATGVTVAMTGGRAAAAAVRSSLEAAPTITSSWPARQKARYRGINLEGRMGELIAGPAHSVRAQCAPLPLSTLARR